MAQVSVKPIRQDHHLMEFEIGAEAEHRLTNVPLKREETIKIGGVLKKALSDCSQAIRARVVTQGQIEIKEKVYRFSVIPFRSIDRHNDIYNDKIITSTSKIGDVKKEERILSISRIANTYILYSPQKFLQSDPELIGIENIFNSIREGMLVFNETTLQQMGNDTYRSDQSLEKALMILTDKTTEELGLVEPKKEEKKAEEKKPAKTKEEDTSDDEDQDSAAPAAAAAANKALPSPREKKQQGQKV